MKLGRCVDHDFGHIGCYADVKGYFNRLCSGKTSCRVQVSPLEIESSQGCMKGLEKYLDVSYSCLPGMNICFMYSDFHYFYHYNTRLRFTLSLRKLYF